MNSLNKTLFWTIIIGLFATLFIPFVVSTGLYFPFITGKAFAFRIIVEIVFFAWVILAIRDRSFVPRKSPLLIAASAFVGIIFVANLFGVNHVASFWSNFERMEGFVTIAHLYMYFVVLISVVRTDVMWRRFLMTSVVASGIMVLYGLVQLAGWSEIHQGGGRVDGSMGNASYLAVYMLFSIFITGYLAYVYKNTALRISLGVLMLLQFVIMYYTGTRGAMLGFLGGAVLVALITALRSTDARLKKAGLVAIVALAVVIGGFLLARDSAFVRQSPVLARFASISLEDKTTLSRFIIWGSAWEAFTERPLLGYGQSNFNFIFDSKYDPRLYNQEQWFDRAHNIVFDWLIAGGALGLLAYLSLFGAALYLLWRSPASTLEKGIFTGLLAAYFFQNLFVFDNLMSYVLFFAVLAYIHVNTGPGTDERKGALITDRAMQTSASVVAVAALLFVLYAVNIPAISAASNLLKGISVGRDAGGALLISQGSPEKHLALLNKAVEGNTFGNPEARSQFLQTALLVAASSGVSDATKLQFVQRGIDEVAKQIQETPNDARYPYLLGTAFAQLGQLELAEQYLQQAVALSPRKQILRINLPFVWLQIDQKGNAEKALAYAKETYELETEDPNAWNAYARVALFVGDTELAKQLIMESLATGQAARVSAFSSMMIQGDPANVELRLFFASLYAEAGNKEQAVMILEQGKKDLPAASALFSAMLATLQ